MRVILTRFVQISIGLKSPSLVIGIFLSYGYRKNIFHIGVLSPAFRRKSRGQRALLVPAVFQVPLAPNNSYAKVTHFRVTCSATLQC